ncbi:MAG: M14 family zinc carboxypeptidase [Bacteroidota bacterium]
MYKILLPALLFFFLAAPPRGDASDRPVRFHGSSPGPILRTGPVDPRIPPPDSILGHPLGERPVRHGKVLEYIRALEAATGRVRSFRMSEPTYEGRPLTYVLVTDEANMADLPRIKADLAALADPRTMSEERARDLIRKTPVCVWLAYSIHGDELSGVDASLAVLYHLAAGEDSLTRAVRRDMIIIVDPIQNPDGRERYLAQIESFSSAVPHADGQSLQKGGFWPWGRGNHYLFDMNRDWFTLELPESRARMHALVEWHPQVVVDAHEMGQWDTYLFSPARAPFNLFLTPALRRWWETFASDQAGAFDERGWAYYTREWNEEWFPGYGSSWPLFAGAVGILYEQAGIVGSVSRHDGSILSYGETVEHQYISSMANVGTALRNREGLLRHYHEHRKQAVERFGGGAPRAFLVAPGEHPDRAARLCDILRRQEVEVFTSSRGFRQTARGYYDTRAWAREFSPGTIVIPANQPQGFLIQTILGFDQRLPDSFLVEERRELLKNRGSRLYEVTSWSLLEAYALDACEAEGVPGVPLSPWTPPNRSGGLIHPSPRQGFLLDATNEPGLRAAVDLLGAGVRMHAARKALDVEARAFPRGTVFMPVRSNGEHLAALLDSVCRMHGVTAEGVHSGRGASGPDLGGRELELLRAPKVALVAGGSTSFTSVGWTWHLLDQKLGVPASLLDIGQIGGLDLSIYNVLILPEGRAYAAALGKPAIGKIRDWVEAGGTLIALGSGARFCADSAVGLSRARPRSQVLMKLGEYERAARNEMEADRPDIGSLGVWEYRGADTSTGRKERRDQSPEELQQADEMARLFGPQGSILRADLDTEHWLTFGMGARLPVMVTGGTPLMAQHPPVRTVGRFASGESLRISGLLWPEARRAFALSSWCTVEEQGKGQVILFASQPNFRSSFPGAERMLANAVVFGPGMGTRWTPPW